MQLVLALDTIRKYAQEAGASVGPIVLLSYKNGALNEMLVDVLQSDQRFARTGALIRCGNPDDPRLIKYKESATREESHAQMVLAERLACVRNAHRTVRDWRELAREFRDAAADASCNREVSDVVRRLEAWSPRRRKDRRHADDEATAGFVDAVQSALLLHARARQDGTKKDPSLRTPEEAHDLLQRLGNSHASETLDSDIMTLAEGVEHWIDKRMHLSRWCFLIERWLRGDRPPPRCKAHEEDGCVLAVAVPGTYCEYLHNCQYPTGCRMRRSVFAAVVYCDEHRCPVISEIDGSACASPRRRGGEACTEHSCRYCVRTRMKPIKCVSSPRALACSDHGCRFGGCLQEHISPKLGACRSHCCKLCLAVFTDRTDEYTLGSLCVRLEDSDYCLDHSCTLEGCSRMRAKSSEAPQNLCELHACKRCIGIRQVVDPICPQSRLCERHRCAHADATGRPCERERIDASTFCEEHVCRVCRLEGLALDMPVFESPPRNVCKNHPLCIFQSRSDGSLCTERAPVGSLYCARHAERARSPSSAATQGFVKMQCEGLTKKAKRRCKTVDLVPPGTKRHFCTAHADQKPKSESESDSSEDDDSEEASSSASELSSASESDVENEYVELTNEPHEDVVELADSDQSEAESSDSIDGVEETKEEMPLEDGDGKFESNDVTSEVPIVEAIDDNPQDAADEVIDDLGEEDEAVDVGEHAAFGVSRDEIDLDDDETEDDENEQLRHLRDIVGDESETSCSSDDDGDNEDRDDDAAAVVAAREMAQDVACTTNVSDPAAWSWTSPSQDRWRTCAQFIHKAAALVAELILEAEEYLELARLEKAEAAAQSFKLARCVGATVVGATRRLEAIRASEPFAMIVEEACEVLEPTLLAVLAVRSLQFVELIGDHRQLPAFVQQCWFPLETTHPSIKTSLFERLVEASPDAAAPRSILDEQRRMRPAIADLTRSHYRDVVEIVDHECTGTQRIGDRVCKVNSSTFQVERQLWQDEGPSRVLHALHCLDVVVLCRPRRSWNGCAAVLLGPSRR